MILFLNIFFPIFLVFFILFSTKYLIQIFKTLGIYDIPKKRSNHKVLKPKGAGILLTLTIFFSLLFLMIVDSIEFSPWIFLLPLMLLISIFSFLDDVKNISSTLKLSVHCVVILISIGFLDNQITDFCLNLKTNYNFVFKLEVLEILIKIMIFILWLWITNLVNFMDGIDGITSLQVCFFSLLIVCLSLINVLSSDYSYIGLVVFSVFLGFLYWNKPPSKIFLGDSGSVAIGFFIGGVYILSLLNTEGFIPLTIIMLYYFADSTFTIIRRAFHKKNVFEAHSDHYYQRKVRSGFSHAQVLNSLLLFNIVLFILSVLYFNFPIFSIVLSVLTVLVFIYWLNLKEKNK